MATAPKNIPAIDDETEQWSVIIETPKGSCNKYKHEVELNIFKLAMVLPEGLRFPYDFGYIPSTLGEDGDPLDVLLFMDEPTFAGCLVPSRLIGVIEAKQTERDGTTQRNDRIIAIPQRSHRYAKVRALADLDEEVVKQLGKFFQTYNEQTGKKFKVLNLRGPKRAAALARDGIKRFSRKQRPKKK